MAEEVKNTETTDLETLLADYKKKLKHKSSELNNPEFFYDFVVHAHYELPLPEAISKAQVRMAYNGFTQRYLQVVEDGIRMLYPYKHKEESEVKKDESEVQGV